MDISTKPTPKSEASQKRRWSGVVFVLIVVAFFAYDAYDRHRLEPPEVLTLEGLFDWQPAEHSARETQRGGKEHLIVYGRLGGFVASGPSAYVFDKSGKLIDSSIDTGDDPQFQSRWPASSAWMPIDRESAVEWMSK